MKLPTHKTVLIAAALLAFTASQLRAELLYGLQGNRTLVRFDSAAPSATSSVLVQGLQAGEAIYSIDVRPADGRLYGVGSTNRLYVIDPLTGVATQIGTAGAFSANGAAMDFDPQSDQLRFVTGDRQNQRINPNDGTLIANDVPVTPASFLAEGAYDRNDTQSGTATTLYGIDFNSVANSYNLVRIGGPDGTPSASTGVTTVIGSLGLSGTFFPIVGFDISGLTGAAFATVVEGVGNEAIESFTRLYSINLATGEATLLGTVGGPGTRLFGLTAAPIPEPSTYALLLAGVGLLGFVQRRRRAAR